MTELGFIFTLAHHIEDDAEQRPSADNDEFLPCQSSAGAGDQIHHDHEAGQNRCGDTDKLIMLDLKRSVKLRLLFSQDQKGHRHHQISQTARQTRRVGDPNQHLLAEERRR